MLKLNIISKSMVDYTLDLSADIGGIYQEFSQTKIVIFIKLLIFMVSSVVLCTKQPHFEALA